jgi:hypothetical protein
MTINLFDNVINEEALDDLPQEVLDIINKMKIK